MFLKENSPCSGNLQLPRHNAAEQSPPHSQQTSEGNRNTAVKAKLPAVWICTSTEPRTGVGTDGLADRTAFLRATLPPFPSQAHERVFYLHDELRLR